MSAADTEEVGIDPYMVIDALPAAAGVAGNADEGLTVCILRIADRAVSGFFHVTRLGIEHDRAAVLILDPS